MNQSEKQKVLVVCGPTASGKTALGVALCQRLGGEVVSADSMQIYRELSIATAKPTPEEMQGIPHHLIDFLSITQPFSVAQYVRMADETIRDIASRGKVPVVVGGTGLYIHSLIDHIQYARQAGNPLLREKLHQRAALEGGEALLKELAEVDPDTACRLHPNDIGRIVRALEVAASGETTLSQQKKESRKDPSPYDPFWIGLDFADRAVLYDRIDRRVDIMMKSGLLEETKAFLQGEETPTAVQAIGCKELGPYLRGECSLEQAVEHLKRQTRRYAKRQLSWFRREERMHWYRPDELGSLDAVLDKIEQDLSLRGFFPA